MKKFIIRVLTILTSTGIIFCCINYFLYRNQGSCMEAAPEVFDAINRAGDNTEYVTLILGDSVARQFFSPENQEESDSIRYLATNQAITPAGNYLLLEKYLQHHSELEEVYYIARPDSFNAKLNFIYSYSYFVTPFFTTEFMPKLNIETIVGIKQIYGSFWCEHGFSKWLLAKYPKMLELYYDACQYLCIKKYQFSGYEAPNVSTEYIRKMKDLCEKNNIVFHLRSAPLPDDYEYSPGVWEIEMEEFELQDSVMELKNSIFYIDKENYRDGCHLRVDYVEKNRKVIAERLLTNEYETGEKQRMIE